MLSLEDTINNYETMYKQFGHAPESLCMPSDRRNIRYYDLLKNFGIAKGGKNHGFSLIDFGCGFGDVNKYLNDIGYLNYNYIGIDIVDSFLSEGEKCYGNENVCFLKKNFWNKDELGDISADYAISSQTLNNRFGKSDNNYEIMFALMQCMYEKVRVGFAFNFFTDKVSFKKNDTAYHDPAKVLDFAYGLSNCVILDNGTLPYECTITVLKQNTCKKYGNVFDMFYENNIDMFKDGVFVVKEK